MVSQKPSFYRSKNNTPQPVCVCVLFGHPPAGLKQLKLRKTSRSRLEAKQSKILIWKLFTDHFRIRASFRVCVSDAGILGRSLAAFNYYYCPLAR